MPPRAGMCKKELDFCGGGGALLVVVVVVVVGSTGVGVADRE